MVENNQKTSGKTSIVGLHEDPENPSVISRRSPDEQSEDEEEQNMERLKKLKKTLST